MQTTAYNIGGLIYSLDVIEHGILRGAPHRWHRPPLPAEPNRLAARRDAGNRPHPATGFRVLGAHDPRRAFSIDPVDPRIHFTLVCGAKSCPAIRVYSGANLERGLQAAMDNFCGQEVQVNVDAHSVRGRRAVAVAGYCSRSPLLPLRFVTVCAGGDS